MERSNLLIRPPSYEEHMSEIQNNRKYYLCGGVIIIVITVIFISILVLVQNS